MLDKYNDGKISLAPLAAFYSVIVAVGIGFYKLAKVSVSVGEIIVLAVVVFLKLFNVLHPVMPNWILRLLAELILTGGACALYVAFLLLIHKFLPFFSKILNAFMAYIGTYYVASFFIRQLIYLIQFATTWNDKFEDVVITNNTTLNTVIIIVLTIIGSYVGLRTRLTWLNELLGIEENITVIGIAKEIYNKFLSLILLVKNFIKKETINKDSIVPESIGDNSNEIKNSETN